MANISSGTASVITGGINAVASYFATKGVASAQKDAARAQEHLIELQAEEQQLKNNALKASLYSQNQSLPFAVSNPSLPANAYSGGVALSAGAPSGPRTSAAVMAGGGSTVIIIAVGAIIALVAILPGIKGTRR